jgi:hypothetical protein
MDLRIRKIFFSEEKKQKTFDFYRLPRRQRAQRDKSFLVLFFKKERFIASLIVILGVCRALRSACRTWLHQSASQARGAGQPTQGRGEEWRWARVWKHGRVSTMWPRRSGWR